MLLFNGKKLRVFTAFCFVISISFVFLSCVSGRKSILPEEPPLSQPDAFDFVLEEAKLHFSAQHYQKAADILRSIGQQDYTHYRMDEVLYWLGRCNLRLKNAEKANRCFELLRKYYPRSIPAFPHLEKLEERTQEALALLEESRAQAANHNDEDSIAVQKYGGPLVSNSFYETDIRQALMDLSAQTEIAIIPDALVRGYITMDIIDVPLEKALSLMLSPFGYSFNKIEDYYMVGAPVADNPSFPLLAKTEEIRPKHLPAADVPKLIPDFYSGFLKINAATNTLVISAPPEIIERFKDELAAIDHPPQQIMIEAVVVEMGEDAIRTLGLDWDWTGTVGNRTFQVSKLTPAISDSNIFFGELLRSGEYLRGMTFDLRTALRALASKDLVNIRANPRVSTLDGQEATVRIGREAYYSIQQGSALYAYATLERISTGILLKITPYVGSASDITTDIVIEVSDVTGAGATDLPVTSVRSVETRVQVANGQTIGIGGLVSETTRNQRSRIPFLGDIPILGYLFGTTTTEKIKTEVVVLITPHLLINPSEFDNL